MVGPNVGSTVYDHEQILKDFFNHLCTPCTPAFFSFRIQTVKQCKQLILPLMIMTFIVFSIKS